MSILRKGFVAGGWLDDLIGVSSSSRPTGNDSETIDEFWMKEAFRESLKSVGRCNPNPAVGCVIVKNGTELARGHTQPFGGRHAEREAFASIKDPEALRGATVYVTLEPCSHVGRQPPCVEILVDSAVACVVIGRKDSDPRVNGEGIQRLLRAGKKVRIGTLSDEITSWNYPFFFSRKTPRPLFALKWAQTLDGQMADDSGESRWISGTKSRTYTHWLRQKYDAILVGSATLLADAPKLTVRDCELIKRQPLRMVFDPHSRILDAPMVIQNRLNEKCFTKTNPFIVLTGKESDQAKIARLYPEAKSVVLSSGSFEESMIRTLQGPEILAALGKPLNSVFVEGGPRLLTQFVNSSCADVIHAFIAPQITGGVRNRLAPGFSLAKGKRYRMLATENIEEDTLIEMVDETAWARVSDHHQGDASCFAS